MGKWVILESCYEELESFYQKLQLLAVQFLAVGGEQCPMKSVSCEMLIGLHVSKQIQISQGQAEHQRVGSSPA